MIEEIHQFLLARGDGAEPADAEELLGCLFNDSGEDAEFGREFLEGLLAYDPRFEQVAPGRWQLATGSILDLPLDRAPLVIVDLESTGQRAEETSVTEIGAARLEGEQETGRFERLVNPWRPIPPYVAKLTGISDSMVADAPPLSKVIGDFVEFSRDAVLVAHNAAFDVALLDHASRAILGGPLCMPSLCTLKLARQLLPGLDKASLDALAAHFGLAKQSRHRAMADAEITAAVLKRFMRMLVERGINTVGGMIAAQDGDALTRRMRMGLPRRELESLPTGAGVFWLENEKGETLFVARSQRIRHQVAGYFIGAAHLSDRQIEMVSSAVHVGFRQTYSDVEAMLRESKELRRRKPLYNRADRHLPRGNFVKVALRGRYPRVLVGSRIAGDGALYLGPLRGKSFAEDAADLLARIYRLRTCPGRMEPDPQFEPCYLGPAGWCSSPCNDSVDANGYRRQVEELQRDLAGDGSAIRARVGKSEDSARDGAVLSRLLKLNKRRPWVVNSQSYLAALPGAPGALVVVVIVGGFCRLVTEIRSVEDLDAGLADSSIELMTSRRRVGPFEADASTIFAHWIRSPEADEGLVVALDDSRLGESMAEARDELMPVLESLG